MFFSDSADNMDPRASLPPAERSRLRQMAADVARTVLADLLATLGMDEDARWRLETDRSEHGWTAAERRRFTIWLGTGQNASDARTAWTNTTRLEFLRVLLADGRIGSGDRETIGVIA